MQPTLPAPPVPLFGIMTFGFVYIAIYVLVRLSKDGDERFQACKKTMFVGIPGMVIVALLESLNHWNWSQQHQPVNSFPVLFATLVFGFQFIIIMWIDLGVQWFLMKR